LATFNAAAAVTVVDFKGDTWELVPFKYVKGALWWFCNEVIRDYTLVPLPVFSEWWDVPPTREMQAGQKLAA
jgi:hypothetical protein